MSSSLDGACCLLFCMFTRVHAYHCLEYAFIIWGSLWIGLD